MNAYQLPFNTGTATGSPFNYFPQNSHSYGVISSSYGSPRTASNLQHKSSMTTQASSFVTPSNYFHQSHLQPFSTFTNSVQSSNGTTAAYAHNHYSAYTGTNSSGTNMSQTTTNSQTNNFDYSHGGYGNTSTNAAAAAAAYPYIASCSTTNQYSSYSQNSINSSMTSSSIANNNSTNNNNNNTNSITYQTSTNPEPYLSLCGNRIDNNDDMYTLNLNKNNVENHHHSLVPMKKSKRSGRGRTRRNNNSNSNLNPSPSPENNIDRIFIWYIDETILTYLSVSEYNRFTGFNDTLTASLYNEIFMFINKFAEKYLFLSDLKDIDQSHIDDSAADDNGQDLSNYNFTADGFKTSVSCNMGSTLNSADLRQKMALRYRKINETYTNYCDKLDELLDKSDYEQLQDLIKRFDLFSKNWIHPAIKALSFIKTRPNCLNVLISSSPLIYTLSKMLIFNLGTYFSIGNVYSCAKTSKEHTLNRVLNRFGSSCTYIVVGKGSEEQQLSQKLELPFWPITEREHFESLLNAMHYFF